MGLSFHGVCEQDNFSSKGKYMFYKILTSSRNIVRDLTEQSFEELRHCRVIERSCVE